LPCPITPVNPNGDELYHILRKRLFETVAPEPKSRKVAEAYREALREAAQMNLTTTSPESLVHPRHRCLPLPPRPARTRRQVQGKRRLPANPWRHSLDADGGGQPLELRKAAGIDLIHPYDLDLNLDEIASEVRTINPSLSEAIAHDIAHAAMPRLSRSTGQRQLRCLGCRAPDPRRLAFHHAGRHSRPA
jgi:hypothetical protein